MYSQPDSVFVHSMLQSCFFIYLITMPLVQAICSCRLKKIQVLKISSLAQFQTEFPTLIHCRLFDHIFKKMAPEI